MGVPFGVGVCFCKYCWDTTGCDRIDITVKEGEIIKGESSLLDFLGIARIEQEDMNISCWKFKVDLQSDDDKHPSLVERYGEVKSLGVIAFNGVGQGDSVVCGRFQVERVTHEWLWKCQGDWPAEERTYLHREVTGSVNNSRLYNKFYDGVAEEMHESWWSDPMTNQIVCGVNSFSRMEESEESDPKIEDKEVGSEYNTPAEEPKHQTLTEDVVAKVNDIKMEDIQDEVEVTELNDCPTTSHNCEKVQRNKMKDAA